MPHVRTKPNGSIQIIYRNPLKRKYEYRNFPPKTPNKVIKAELLKIEYEIQAQQVCNEAIRGTARARYAGK